MDLYILRHAIAAELGTPGIKDDFERPLTNEGAEKLRRITKALRKLELNFEIILSSPYVRARETAEIVAEELSVQKRLEMRDSLGADGDFRELIAELAKLQPTPENILLVGHEPYLTQLIGLLVTGTARSFVNLKKAGLCKLSITKLRVGRCAEMNWLLTPKQLLLMA